MAGLLAGSLRGWGMVGAAAMAPWREFWPLPLTGPSQPLALHSDTMGRLPRQGPIRSAALRFVILARLPYGRPNQPAALHSDTMARLPYDRRVSRVSLHSETTETTSGNRCMSIAYTIRDANLSARID
ncbi:hypothetical protein UFOVP383_78 [uncultured Caudovirales phage]|uniref:Uncharacterized protein n=1 Tax=uncultured Caudovirales phage TaxID=2100421 RepID=A0A6J7X0F9_9CAUD|nr:hypothetical protein UFOVP383_78 [uncultured Caudovirales phage]